MCACCEQPVAARSSRQDMCAHTLCNATLALQRDFCVAKIRNACLKGSRRGQRPTGQREEGGWREQGWRG